MTADAFVVTGTEIRQTHHAVAVGKGLQLDVRTSVLVDNHVALVAVRYGVDFQITSPGTIVHHAPDILAVSDTMFAYHIKRLAILVHEGHEIVLVCNHVAHRIATHLLVPILVAK